MARSGFKARPSGPPEMSFRWLFHKKNLRRAGWNSDKHNCPVRHQSPIGSTHSICYDGTGHGNLALSITSKSPSKVAAYRFATGPEKAAGPSSRKAEVSILLPGVRMGTATSARPQPFPHHQNIACHGPEAGNRPDTAARIGHFQNTSKSEAAISDVVDRCRWVWSSSQGDCPWGWRSGPEVISR